ncbi:hypothetical protein [Fluviicola taffensis]|uniref:Uncharacterized protein n=1 Tax=Fluviicola taffensis (strain DSM 16823 / NCIMB 13979 / RW262) TaxID=755732 RepID=F2IBB4_FLUTR|nr:hypothetical protein [Fluviicola taffensis]AEA43200.1 hypothetical protein Fluta_1205 [Fluviicola taffensis DSM 16823]
MKRKFTWNSRVTVGMIIGIISPFLFVPLIVGLIAWSQNYPYSVLWNNFTGSIVAQSKFISLSIIPNLIWFYLFLNKERYDLARGVIVGSALFLPFILYVNLIR